MSARSRFLGVVGLCTLGLVVFAAACDDDHEGHRYGGGGSGGMGCEQITSCGACTPVTGCGWCATSDGKGLCASDPDECASASAFTWTWDPSGCVSAVDASAVTIVPVSGDAGSILVPTTNDGAAPTDSAPSTESEASTDAANGVDASDAADGS